MVKLTLVILLACLAVTLAEPKVPQRGLIHQIQGGVAGPNPYIFLTVPRGRSQALVQGFEVIDDNDDDDDEDNKMHNDEEDSGDDDDDSDQHDDEEEDEDIVPKNDANYDEEDDDEEEIHDVMNMNIQMKKPNHQIKNAKPTQMMVSREHAGAIMVPDEIIEIEGQSVIDEETGKPALLLPRAILDTIPDGSVVALMERSYEPSTEEQERANRVIVRRRRKGARRNVKRRRGASNNRRVNRRGGNNRRRVNGNNVRINRRGGNRRRGNNRRKNNRRRVVYQG